MLPLVPLHTIDRVAVAAMIATAALAAVALQVACATPSERVARFMFAGGD